ncbi:galactosylgalactosylxylosylprotein 3-beta-glucuronosyltransferase P [Neodiprion pinetum]|uniref:galactosylgalactosylxylosylprotein 3-beta-glucuronosyltransferase P n=1 Tax=Neodiprion pinetum TaxID=441929 RepID=UPI001EE0CC9B|nr:galactosylgalactosylxylosylprotein 3-beta-glucuronosyltransferase P [Neodiprion pinetum]XP_046481624.1 galactosylgalactosylxylosylprotein 3-beta-glucuronosyltransferase P [Neodiprion pinetum]XP_046481625.1 galactosylgalactosylxylosylprotein 3-beta-glucuronosyltransferase P [Neodiprion pinetum]
MKPALKMGMIALVGICLVFYQYHLSFGIRVDQIPASKFDLNAGQPPDGPDGIPVNSDTYGCSIAHQKLTEEMIRHAVDAVRKSNGLGPEIGVQLTEEILNQLNKLTIGNRGKDRLLSQTPAQTTINSVVAAADKFADENPLYVITPTYRRPEQVPELTRMAHTLMLVKNVHWLVIEDAHTPTQQVTDLLRRTGLKYEHLVAPMPEQYKKKNGAKPRGVSNRNRGLQWIRANATSGVFYFADDDNTYDIKLFDEIRTTRKVSMWPVGLCTKFGLSTPIVKNGKFIGFYDGWMAGRKFPVDMAGFAVSVKFLLERPKASMPFRPGYEEDGFLKSLAPFNPSEIELLADNCSQVLAWHTQTKKNEPSAALDKEKYASTNLIKLKQQIV